MHSVSLAASRALFRPQPAALRAGLRRPVRPFDFLPRQNVGLRLYSTAGDAAAEAAAKDSRTWFQRMWNSPVGLKTVHFWAPAMKWCLVIAGISDFARPVEKLSVTQNAALTATGTIWTRWALIIKPKNVLLAAVNAFLAVVGVIQLSRIGLYHQQQKKRTQEQEGSVGPLAA